MGVARGTAPPPLRVRTHAGVLIRAEEEGASPSCSAQTLITLGPQRTNSGEKRRKERESGTVSQHTVPPGSASQPRTRADDLTTATRLLGVLLTLILLFHFKLVSNLSLTCLKPSVAVSTLHPLVCSWVHNFMVHSVGSKKNKGYAHRYY